MGRRGEAGDMDSHPHCTVASDPRHNFAGVRFPTRGSWRGRPNEMVAQAFRVAIAAWAHASSGNWGVGSASTDGQDAGGSGTNWPGCSEKALEDAHR